jgi:hypothetical protein
MPKRDLSESCLRFQATHLVLTSTVSTRGGAKDDTPQYLHFLDRNLSAKTSIWAAGPNIRPMNFKMKRDFKILDSFQSFEKELQHV